MERDKELDGLLEDLNKIINLFKEIETSTIKDVDSLKEKSILLQKELKDRYGEENTPQTDSPKA